MIFLVHEYKFMYYYFAPIVPQAIHCLSTSDSRAYTGDSRTIMTRSVFLPYLQRHLAAPFFRSLLRCIDAISFKGAGPSLLAIASLGLAITVVAEVGKHRQSVWILSDNFIVSELTVSTAEVPVKPGGTPANRPVVATGTITNVSYASSYPVRIRLTVGLPNQEYRFVVHGFPEQSSLLPGAITRFVIPFNAPRGIASVMAVVEEHALQRQ